MIEGGYGNVSMAPPRPSKDLWSALSKGLSKAKSSKTARKDILEQHRAAWNYAKESADVALRGLTKKDPLQGELKTFIKDGIMPALRKYERHLKSPDVTRAPRTATAGTTAQFFQKKQVPWNAIPGFKMKDPIKSKNDPRYKALVATYNMQHPDRPW